MKTLLIADPGSNWRAYPDEPLDRAWERARQLIREAKNAGFAVCKFQALSADLMYEADTPAWHLVKPYELPIDWYPRLKEECDNEGIEFAISVYHESQVALVDPLVERHKLASFEWENLALAASVVRTEKPLLLSTGCAGELFASDLDRHRKALRRVTEFKHPVDVTYLHCVSSYPARIEDQQLAIVQDWFADYDDETSWRYGFSDHTPQDSAVAAVVAVALGATVIEVHTRTDEQTVSPDCLPHARDPLHAAVYVESIRQAEEALGDGTPVLGTSAKYKWDPATGKRGQ